MPVFVAASYLKLTWSVKALRLCSDQQMQYIKNCFFLLHFNETYVLAQLWINDEAPAKKKKPGHLAKKNVDLAQDFFQHNAQQPARSCTVQLLRECCNSTVTFPIVEPAICFQSCKNVCHKIVNCLITFKLMCVSVTLCCFCSAIFVLNTR